MIHAMRFPLIGPELSDRGRSVYAVTLPSAIDHDRNSSRFPGHLVVLEGASGVGKSTAASRLSNSTALGTAPLLLKLPSPGPLGRLAREFLEQGLHETVAFTAAADRTFVAEVKIIPALSAGRAVLLDRYVMSALALNRLSGIGFDDTFALCTRLPRPNHTILLVGSPAVAAQRLSQRDNLDRYERGEGLDGLGEHEVFAEAADYLRARGWRITTIETGSLDEAETVAAIEDQLAGSGIH